MTGVSKKSRNMSVTGIFPPEFVHWSFANALHDTFFEWSRLRFLDIFL